MTSTSTRLDPRSSPGPSTKRVDTRDLRSTASRRSVISSAKPSPRSTTASTTHASSTPRRAHEWARTRPRSRPRARGNEVGDHPAGPARPVAGVGGRRVRSVVRRTDPSTQHRPWAETVASHVSGVDGFIAHRVGEASSRPAAGLRVAIVQRDRAGVDPGDAAPHRQPIVPEGRPARDRGAGAPARSRQYTALLEEGERWPHT